MIAHLNGRLIEKTPTALIIECSGVGYEVKISLNTYSAIGKDESIKIFTQFIVREDAQILYGFQSIEEREMFNLLTSVSGIGPNTAILMLSSLIPYEIAQAITRDDVNTIKSIKGIGLKTAQRVIVDLKDKVLKFEGETNNLTILNNTIRFDALTALISLGFDKKAAENALNKIFKDQDTVELLIKDALKVL
jgi:Holliday junction DNA helicase RuvA